MVLCSSALLVLAFYGAGFAGLLEQGGAYPYTRGKAIWYQQHYGPVEQGGAYPYTAGVIGQESKNYYTVDATTSENKKPATDETQQNKEAERREPNCEGGVCRI